MEILVITGMSGSGKSQAANTLEDIGYFCIDNMPVLLIPKFAELYTQMPGRSQRIAFIIDVRGETEFDTLLNNIKDLKSRGLKCQTFFIDCDNDILLNRYKETRRTHPLMTAKGLSLNKAIEIEREMLSPVRDYADYTIDTTGLSIKQFREKVKALFKSDDSSLIAITCMSFGFKYGIATESDLVFDVRCFPNPYYVKELADKTGLCKDVADYVFSGGAVDKFMNKLEDMLDFLIPQYKEEGKTQLTIGIGCTGGKHRSVAICERLNEYLMANGYNSITVHRDINKIFT